MTSAVKHPALLATEITLAHSAVDIPVSFQTAEGTCISHDIYSLWYSVCSTRFYLALVQVEDEVRITSEFVSEASSVSCAFFSG